MSIYLLLSCQNTWTKKTIVEKLDPLTQFFSDKHVNNIARFLHTFSIKSLFFDTKCRLITDGFHIIFAWHDQSVIVLCLLTVFPYWIGSYLSQPITAAHFVCFWRRQSLNNKNNFHRIHCCFISTFLGFINIS